VSLRVEFVVVVFSGFFSLAPATCGGSNTGARFRVKRFQTRPLVCSSVIVCIGDVEDMEEFSRCVEAWRRGGERLVVREQCHGLVAEVRRDPVHGEFRSLMFDI
jgi:hypothetical protein